MGRRLSWSEGPKALVPLLGLPLLTRAILVAREAGISDFVVVVGHQGEKIIESLGDGSSLGVRLIYVINEEWTRGNGLSVLKARNELRSRRFLILMADHVLDPSIIQRMLRYAPRAPAMAVDVTVRDSAVLEEATRVLARDRKVLAVAKGLTEYNGVDMGVILADESIFDALERSIGEGNEELGGALNLLAREGRLRAVEFRDSFWVDVDTPESLAKAKRELLRRLVKPEDGPVSRYLNRRVSTAISSRLVQTSITPNQMSLIAFVIALGAAVLFSLTDALYLVIGGLLAQLSSILDGCDGELARLKFRTSPAGAWTDAVMDRYADFALIAALAFGQWRISLDWIWWAAAVFALAGAFGVSYTSAAYRSSGRPLPTGRQIPAKRDTRILVIAVAAIIGFPLYGLVLIGALGNAEVFRRLLTWR